MVGEERGDGLAEGLFAKVPIVHARQVRFRHARSPGHRRQSEVGGFGHQHGEECRADLGTMRGRGRPAVGEMGQRRGIASPAIDLHHNSGRSIGASRLLSAARAVFTLAASSTRSKAVTCSLPRSIRASAFAGNRPATSLVKACSAVVACWT